MAIPKLIGTAQRRSFLNQKFSPSLPILVEEVATLLDLKSASRVAQPGQEIVREGKRCTSVSLILDGMAVRYRILRDGQRQILNFLLPGDFAGAVNSRFATAIFPIKTLTEALIAPIPVAKLMTLLDSHPRLAAGLLWAFSSEMAIVAERLIAIGRRSAQERVAHLLLELFVRLQKIGLADERSYRLPLTQEMISDALGLSIPYVNRVLHQLRDEGLVRIKDQVVVIEDLDELAALADFEHAYLKPLSIGDLLEQA